jgi:hypothetical protein
MKNSACIPELVEFMGSSGSSGKPVASMIRRPTLIRGPFTALAPTNQWSCPRLLRQSKMNIRSKGRARVRIWGPQISKDSIQAESRELPGGM